MNLDNYLVIGILAVSLVLFALDKRADIVALSVLIATVFTGLVTPEDAFLGFSNSAVITVIAVFILSGGLIKTGVADSIGRQMIRVSGNSPIRLLIVMMLTGGLLSGFMNNVGAVAIILPAVISACHRLNYPTSKMLIPLAASGLLGGNITLIGTPPNLIANEILQSSGITPFGFFTFTPSGLIVLGTGILYMVFIGRFLLPDRGTKRDLSGKYDLHELIAEVEISPESDLIETPINNIRYGPEYGVNLIYVRRIIEGLEDEYVLHSSDRYVRAGDHLLLEGTAENIKRLCQDKGFTLMNTSSNSIDEILEEGDGKLVEITLSPKSKFREKTLRSLGFRSRYELNVLAIRHEGEVLTSNVADVPLRFGDMLLVQGAAEDIGRLRSNPNFMILADQSMENEISEFDTTNPQHKKRAMIVFSVTLLSILAMTFISHPIYEAIEKMDIAPIWKSKACVLADEPGDSCSPYYCVPSTAVVNPAKLAPDNICSANADAGISQEAADAKTLCTYDPANSVSRHCSVPGNQTAFIISLLMLTGAVFMLLTKCLNMDEAYQAIEWKSIFLIAGLLPLGVAMETTGTAAVVADSLIKMELVNPIMALVILFAIGTMLTSVISNAAAIYLMVPIAIQLAQGIAELKPEYSLIPLAQAFVMTTVIACSADCLMPIGHQANIIVQGPGNYKFFDFFKVGLGLNITLLIVTVIIIPFLFKY